jgi:hypothetical protein
MKLEPKGSFLLFSGKFFVVSCTSTEALGEDVLPDAQISG